MGDNARHALSSPLARFHTRLGAPGDTFPRFEYLETIILETHHSFSTERFTPLLEMLRRVSGVEVQHRTYEEGHKLALQAKKRIFDPARVGVVSPLWCIDKHAHDWPDM